MVGPPPPSVTSHYSPKQARSSSIFYVQRQNAADSSFGCSSLGVRMADMIMSITDRIKVTLADGGWQHSSCNLRARRFVCLQSSPSVQWQLTLQWADVGLIHVAAVPIKHNDPGRSPKVPSTVYRQSGRIKFPSVELHDAGVGVGVGLDDLNLTLVGSKYLSGVLLDILRPALVPVRQEIDGRGGRAEPQQVGRLLVQEGVIIQQILTQHGPEGTGKTGGFTTETHNKHNIKVEPSDEKPSLANV